MVERAGRLMVRNVRAEQATRDLTSFLGAPVLHRTSRPVWRRWFRRARRAGARGQPAGRARPGGGPHPGNQHPHVGEPGGQYSARAGRRHQGVRRDRNTVYVGGSFTSVKAAGGTSWTSRNYLFAYDRTSGALKADFTPTLDGAVHALAASPDGKLIVGGAFKNVNGVSRKNLVQLDPATGATITGWVGRSDGGLVRRTVVVGNKLYIAGAFHWVNGTEHSLLARLDATTGAIDPSFQIDASVARASSELVGPRRRPRRQDPGRGGQLHRGQRPAPQPGGGRRPGRHPGGRQLEHPALRGALLQRLVPVLRPGRRLLRRRHVLRDHRGRWPGRRGVLRRDRPVRDRRPGFRPGPPPGSTTPAPTR